MSEATQTGRTVNGHTYTDAPVDVKLGPNTFRIPANYLDSQIAPWPGEGVSLVIEWPDMGPSAPGARANPRTNDFRKEIRILVDFIDRVPIEDVLERHASNVATSTEGSLERGDPASRLDLRVAQPEVMGLVPYTIDPVRLDNYARSFEKQYGTPYPRNPAFEDDWFVTKNQDGTLATLIKCDNPAHRRDGVILRDREVISVDGEIAAGCSHTIVAIEDSLVIRMSYKRAFLREWKAMEHAIRDLLHHTKVVMLTRESVQTPMEQSRHRSEVATADRGQALAQSQQQEVERQWAYTLHTQCNGMVLCA